MTNKPAILPLIAIFSSLLIVFLISVKPKAASVVLPNPNLNIFHILDLGKKEVSLILTGDIMLGRSVMTKSFSLGDTAYPFKLTADRLKGADIVFSNLENPLVTDCPKTDAGMKFCADPGMIGGLLSAGVDIVSLANNHTLNYGLRALEETKKLLSENQIKWVGGGNLEIIEKSGTKFGFLGFDFLSNKPQEKDFQQVLLSDPRVDVLIVGVHWGNEYTTKPTYLQKETARKLIENGADVVAGHHSHWVGEIEHIDTKPVYYSLGNFVFDQPWSEKTKEGLAVELVFRNSRIISEQTLPVYMANIGQPAWKNTGR